MKKIKIMLSAIAVLAIVGGALAFKAQKFGTAYCKGIATNQGETGTFGSCPTLVDSKIAGDQYFLATPLGNNTDCSTLSCQAINLQNEGQ